MFKPGDWVRCLDATGTDAEYGPELERGTVYLVTEVDSDHPYGEIWLANVTGGPFESEGFERVDNRP